MKELEEEFAEETVPGRSPSDSVCEPCRDVLHNNLQKEPIKIGSSTLPDTLSKTKLYKMI